MGADEKISMSAYWGAAIDTMGLQLNPPGGKPARLFVYCSGDWYHIDLPNKI